MSTLDSALLSLPLEIRLHIYNYFHPNPTVTLDASHYLQRPRLDISSFLPTIHVHPVIRAEFLTTYLTSHDLTLNLTEAFTMLKPDCFSHCIQHFDHLHNDLQQSQPDSTSQLNRDLLHNPGSADVQHRRIIQTMAFLNQHLRTKISKICLPDFLGSACKYHLPLLIHLIGVTGPNFRTIEIIAREAAGRDIRLRNALDCEEFMRGEYDDGLRHVLEYFSAYVERFAAWDGGAIEGEKAVEYTTDLRPANDARGTWRVREPMEKLHKDVFGHIRCDSLGPDVLEIIDDVASPAEQQRIQRRHDLRFEIHFRVQIELWSELQLLRNFKEVEVMFNLAGNWKDSEVIERKGISFS